MPEGANVVSSSAAERSEDESDVDHVVIPGLSFVAAVAGLLAGSAAASAASSCVPGWPGTVLLAGQPLAASGVEGDAGSSGTVSLVPGPSGQAVRLDWAIGTGDWVQARYRFPAPVDSPRQTCSG